MENYTTTPLPTSVVLHNRKRLVFHNSVESGAGTTSQTDDD